MSAAGVTSGGELWALTRIAREDILMKTGSRQVKHKVGTRKECSRLELLKAEKEHTRRGDELAPMRQELRWVRIDKDYRFETDEGQASLSDLFRGRSQLLIHHLMFGPDSPPPVLPARRWRTGSMASRFTWPTMT
jgi:predicted dithiol-disulfide oxidoreductase (DUF899 family)